MEELRRLSTLRADFVSLVSHELRSPMAAVIGSARTLQQRWRELKPAQRESFLALIADETNRLATLIADVLDTSRIEAGTFSYTFADVDLAELAARRRRRRRDRAGRGAARDRRSPTRCRAIRGDRERLRQVLGEPRRERASSTRPRASRWSVSASALNGSVLVQRARPRAGHRERGPGADLREVRPRAFGGSAARHGPRPLHRALDRRGARRHARRALGARRGRDVHACASDGLGADAQARDAELLRELFGARAAIAGRRSSGSSTTASPR